MWGYWENPWVLNSTDAWETLKPESMTKEAKPAEGFVSENISTD